MEHIISLTDNGKVYGWCDNYYLYQQLTDKYSEIVYKPSIINIVDDNNCDVYISKIICADYNNMLMDKNKNKWVFGRNLSNECMIEHKDNIDEPMKILYVECVTFYIILLE